MKNINFSHYDSRSLQAKIVFEYLLKRSLRNIKTSQAVGKISKNKILEIVLSVSSRLPEIFQLNNKLKINWSGQFALDATFPKLNGKTFAVLICSDFFSLDIVDYSIAPLENYIYWKKFLLKIYPVLIQNNVIKFFVTDGKRGLHQAISEFFPQVDVQLCITHKQRRINQIIPHIQGDGYDRLFAHLAHCAIRATTPEIYQGYLNILISFTTNGDFLLWSKPRQEKLQKIIGALRWQKNKLHTRYYCNYEIKDPTTNHLEGINSFLKERINLMRGFKKADNTELLIKLLIYYYRFHKFTSSSFKARNGKAPIELNRLKNQKYLAQLFVGNLPESWIKNFLKGT